MDCDSLTPAQAAQIGPALALMDPWKRLGFGADSLTEYLNRPDPSLARFAILHQGELVGALATRTPWLRGPYLELLAILPQAQGQGIGKQALAWAFAKAKAKGALNFWACVSAFNHSARGFYSHMGFIEATELTNLVVAGEHEILLRKVL